MGNRKCRHCGKKNDDRESYFPRHVPKYKMAAFCNSDHFDAFLSSQMASGELVKKGDAIRRKESNKAHRERKKDVKPLKYWQDKLQAVVNQWIVHVRDKEKPCCTCGANSPDIKYDAGHYRSRGACPELRYELFNIHKQCSVNCNQYGSGMRAEYRDFITAVYGAGKLEWLDGNHPPLKQRFPHWSDYEAEILRYRKMLRDAGFKPCA